MSKQARRYAALLLTFVVSLLGIPGVAQANPTAVFTLQHSSGKAGMEIGVNMIDPCPSVLPNSGTYIVWAYLTDAASVTHEALVTFASDSGAWQIEPGGEMIDFPVTVAQGAGSLKLLCDLNGTTTMEYVAQTYTTTAPATAAASQAVYNPGEKISLQAVTECSDPANGGAMGHVLNNLAGWRGLGMPQVTWSNPAGYGVWTVKYDLPLLVDSEEGMQAPNGDYQFDASCWVDGRQMRYAPVYFSVRKLNYVGMGDSFSSGESVESFESGTATSTNECHRSPKAYPRVLEEGLHLNLGSKFVACSGATTHHLTNTWSGKNLTELAQWDHLTADTDLVTVTIGGNNMPFGDFAFACVAPGQSLRCDGQPRTDALAGIVNNVIPNVQSSMTALKGKLDTLGSEAAVLVVGYPQLVPDTYHGTCGWQSYQEVEAIREVTASLNTAIKNEVEAIGGNFHFVPVNNSGSSFIGHELCRSGSPTGDFFFYDENPFIPAVYTFHPNEGGQDAYAEVVREWLQSHMQVLS